MNDPQVDQRRASSQGDMVGRNKIETHHHCHPAPPPGIVEQLLDKLRAEMERDEKTRHTIEELARFHTRRSSDGIDGLQAKLEAGKRSQEYLGALEKKEIFAKLLENWSLYASAQQIFAYLLAQAEHEFNFIIHPQIPMLGKIAVNQLVSDRIVTPTIAQCGSSVFTLNHSIVMGMIYWLTEQCFVKWHE